MDSLYTNRGIAFKNSFLSWQQFWDVLPGKTWPGWKWWLLDVPYWSWHHQMTVIKYSHSYTTCQSRYCGSGGQHSCPQVGGQPLDNTEPIGVRTTENLVVSLEVAVSKDAKMHLEVDARCCWNYSMVWALDFIGINCLAVVPCLYTPSSRRLSCLTNSWHLPTGNPNFLTWKEAFDIPFPDMTAVWTTGHVSARFRVILSPIADGRRNPCSRDR